MPMTWAIASAAAGGTALPIRSRQAWSLRPSSSSHSSGSTRLCRAASSRVANRSQQEAVALKISENSRERLMKLKAEVVGGVVTVAYLFGVAVLVYVKRASLPGLELNAIGDFLAGVFGPIAFLWLVLGYMQQGRELKLSSNALREQASELRVSVAQQAELLKATNKSLENYEKSLEPLLQLVFSSAFGVSLGGVPKERIVLGLINLGDYCEHLVVRVTLNGNQVGVSGCQSLNSGEREELVFDGVFSEALYYDLTVSYSKSNGVSGEQGFEVCKVSKGGFTRVLIEKNKPEPTMA